MCRFWPIFCAIFVVGAQGLLSQTVVYTNQSVAANAEIFGAGNAGLPDGGGTAPPEFALPTNPGVLTMSSVTGLITLNSGGGSNNPDGVIIYGGYSGPTINGSVGYTDANAYGGISGITIPGGGALVGVFEPPTAPTGAAPSNLDFTVIGTNFSTFSPQLYQTFYIGDGLTGDGSGSMQQFIVPTGATRLFLGISDAPGFDGDPGAYGDNYGAFTASFQISTSQPQILAPKISGTNFLFSFQSLSNQSYSVESTTNLSSANWFPNGVLTGTGGLLQFSTPMTNVAQFFRLAVP